MVAFSDERLFSFYCTFDYAYGSLQFWRPEMIKMEKFEYMER